MTEGLRVEGLSIEYRTPRGPVRALRDVSLAVGRGRLLALVGESGSGKSTLAFATAGWMAPNAAIRGGRVLLDGRPVGPADRGRRVAMVFQDPAAALNPSMRLGLQVAEVQMRHRGLDARAAAREAEALLARVRLPDPAAIAARYPHEVSGGEKQRTLIAMALAARPRLLVCDEPTTALDATTAVGILDLIAALRREEGLAVLYVTHDLGIAARVADLATVLYAGTVVESGAAATVLHAPAHPYTRLLLASIPNPHAAERHLPAPLPGAPPDLREPPPGCVFAPRCPLAAEICAAQPPLAGDERHSVACWRADEARRLATPEGAQAAIGAAAAAPLLEVRDLVVTHGRPRLLDRLTGRARTVRAVAGVSLTIRAGETFGLIGESGCGKTSLLRTLAGLSPFAGTVALGGEAVRDGACFPHTWRRDIQLVFQHPDQSLNPRMRVGATLARPLVLHRGLSGGGLRREVMAWLERVRLPAHYAARWPHELSGGEKQRIVIARAFAAGPKLVLCDEVTSGLDASVQAAMLDLLRRLQRATGVALLLVSHDLNMVQGIADRVAVMYLGRIMEARQLAGPFAPPMHPYSEALLAAAPVPDPAVAARPVRLEGPLPSPANPPPGCLFATRCPRRLGPVCDTPPPWRATGPEDGLLCHIPIEDLAAVPPIWRRAA